MADEVALGEVVHEVGDRLGAGPHRDFNRFLEEVKAELPRHGVKMTAKRKKLLQTALAERDETAEPVVKKVHRRGAVAAPIQGLFEVGEGARGRVVEYEPDTKLRDTEQIPLQEEGGLEGFLRREVLPYAPDAWYVPGERQDRLRDQLQPVLLQARADADAGGDSRGDSGGGKGDGGIAPGDHGADGTGMVTVKPYVAMKNSGVEWLGDDASALGQYGAIKYRC